MTNTTISGVEIFRAGTWNGDRYTEADLDEMVANFGRVGFQVPITLGHQKEPGAPAFGWVERLRRVGDKLVADFKDIPDKLRDAIKARHFDNISAEVFFNLKRGGQVFRRVLKAVALLGAETPAVSGLAPLRSVVNSITGFDRAPAYSFSFRMEEHTMYTDHAVRPSAEIDRLARSYVFDHPAVPYLTAVEMIMSRNPDLVASYAQENSGRVRHYQTTDDDPSTVLDRAARELVDADPSLSYSDAAAKAVKTDPDIARQWAQKTFRRRTY